MLAYIMLQIQVCVKKSISKVTNNVVVVKSKSWKHVVVTCLKYCLTNTASNKAL